MQTFLPYLDFHLSAQCLDDKRLNKQITEAYQILQAITDKNYGWQNHPVVNQWREYPLQLLLYIIAMHGEWQRRFNKIHLSYVQALDYYTRHYSAHVENLPYWWNYKPYHVSHQSNLVRKNPEHYRKFFPDVPDNLPYVWVSKLDLFKEKNS